MDNYNILNILDNFIEIYHNNKNLTKQISVTCISHALQYS